MGDFIGQEMERFHWSTSKLLTCTILHRRPCQWLPSLAPASAKMGTVGVGGRGE